jgi:hypothetical protein
MDSMDDLLEGGLTVVDSFVARLLLRCDESRSFQTISAADGGYEKSDLVASLSIGVCDQCLCWRLTSSFSKSVGQLMVSSLSAVLSRLGPWTFRSCQRLPYRDRKV